MSLQNNVLVRDEEEEIINEIEMEMRKIHLSVEKLYNNLSLSETTDPLEKCLITNHCYSLRLLERGFNVELNRDDALKTFENSLQEELEFLCSDLDKMTRKMNEFNELFERIDQNIANLNAMMEATKKDVILDKNLDTINRHVKMRFKKEKSDLKTIISSLFPDNLDIQDLIARIIEHHFAEGSDKYLQLEDGDNIHEQIETLRRTHLFDINPRDVLQIRLADLL